MCKNIVQVAMKNKNLYKIITIHAFFKVKNNTLIEKGSFFKWNSSTTLCNEQFLFGWIIIGFGTFIRQSYLMIFGQCEASNFSISTECHVLVYFNLQLFKS